METGEYPTDCISTPGPFTNLQWTPDGDRIFYNNGDRLYAVPFIGGSPQLILEDVRKGKLDPTGKWVVDTHLPLVMKNLITGEERSVAPDFKFFPADSANLIRAMGWGAGDVFWSPDGAFLGVSSSMSGYFTKDHSYIPPTQFGIVSLADSSFTSRFTIPKNTDSRFRGGGTWSADGFIYFGMKTRGVSNIWRMNPDDAEMTQTTFGFEDAEDPSLSRDGRVMTYTLKSSTTNLWSWDPATQRHHQLTFEQVCRDPVHSPGYDKLTFVSINRGDRSSEIRKGIPPDWNTVLKSPGVIHNPSWSPDLKYLLFGRSGFENAVGTIQLVLMDDQGVQYPLGLQCTEAYWATNGNIYLVGYPKPIGIGLVSGGWDVFVAGDLGVLHGDTLIAHRRDTENLAKSILPVESSKKSREIFSFDISGDGNYIVFRDHDTVGVVDTRTRATTEIIVQGSGPQFHPDGRSITYCQLDSLAGMTKLMQMDLDGTHRRVLVNIPTKGFFTHCWVGGSVVFTKTEGGSSIVLTERSDGE